MHGDWDFLPNAPTKGNKEFLERGAPRRIAWQVLSELEIRAHLAMYQIVYFLLPLKNYVPPTDFPRRTPCNDLTSAL
jgi:hypothetical protein